MQLALSPQFALQPWIGLSPIPHSVVSGPWRHWLLDAGSLTQNLKELAPGRFSLSLIDRRFASPTLSESNALHMNSRQDAYIREVALFIDQQPQIFARSIIPRRTLTGHERQLLTLKQKPLGEFLFTHKNMRRGPIEIKRGFLNGKPVWARRSVFYVNHKPLLVCEYFLPSLLQVKAV
ncbi:chorismate lyase [Oceaniserpentilla sp. 4NH20-0058]|uniref:chorismate--pyruvate lyase family protein n=1 Tax=Oceaniserpentilla sp. 4NH20-0058 TaxID=3127660 RepID=UPI003105F5C0